MMISSAEVNVVLALLAAGYRVRSIQPLGRAIVEFDVPKGKESEASAIADAAMKESQGALLQALLAKLGLMDQAE